MRPLVLWLVLLLGARAGFGQAPAAAAVPAAPVAAAAPAIVAPAWQTKFFEEPDVALPLLTAAALQHSAALAALRTDQALLHEDLQITRKSILGGVQLANSLGYGNVASITVADQTLPSTGTRSSQTTYGTGISVNMSLDRLLSRRNQINRQHLQAQKLGHLQQAQEEAVRRQIIAMYQEVVLAHKVLALRQQTCLTAHLNYQLAEKQFKAGDILLTDVSQLSNGYANAIAERESVASKYTTALLLLEDVLGSRISEVMTLSK